MPCPPGRVNACSGSAIKPAVKRDMGTKNDKASGRGRKGDLLFSHNHDEVPVFRNLENFRGTAPNRFNLPFDEQEPLREHIMEYISHGLEARGSTLKECQVVSPSLT